MPFYLSCQNAIKNFFFQEIFKTPNFLNCQTDKTLRYTSRRLNILENTSSFKREILIGWCEHIYKRASPIFHTSIARILTRQSVNSLQISSTYILFSSSLVSLIQAITIFFVGVLRELLPNGTSKITGFQLSAMIGWHAPFLRVRPSHTQKIYLEKDVYALYSQVLKVFGV